MVFVSWQMMFVLVELGLSLLVSRFMISRFLPSLISSCSEYGIYKKVKSRSNRLIRIIGDKPSKEV